MIANNIIAHGGFENILFLKIDIPTYVTKTIPIERSFISSLEK